MMDQTLEKEHIRLLQHFQEAYLTSFVAPLAEHVALDDSKYTERFAHAENFCRLFLNEDFHLATIVENTKQGQQPDIQTLQDALEITRMKLARSIFQASESHNTILKEEFLQKANVSGHKLTLRLTENLNHTSVTRRRLADEEARAEIVQHFPLLARRPCPQYEGFKGFSTSYPFQEFSFDPPQA